MNLPRATRAFRSIRLPSPIVIVWAVLSAIVTVGWLTYLVWGAMRIAKWLFD